MAVPPRNPRRKTRGHRDEHRAALPPRGHETRRDPAADPGRPLGLPGERGRRPLRSRRLPDPARRRPPPAHRSGARRSASGEGAEARPARGRRLADGPEDQPVLRDARGSGGRARREGLLLRSRRRRLGGRHLEPRAHRRRGPGGRRAVLARRRPRALRLRVDRGEERGPGERRASRGGSDAEGRSAADRRAQNRTAETAPGFPEGVMASGPSPAGTDIRRATPAAPIRVGTAGWSYEDWKGIVYPAAGRAPRGFDPLALMASLFDTNEINSTFYRIPDPRSARARARRVSHNPRFAFTAKLYRGFTHERTAGSPEEKQFLLAMEPLAKEGRLGSLLVQFPVSFRNTEENRAALAAVLDRFASLPLAAEPRHPPWDRADALELLA